VPERLLDLDVRRRLAEIDANWKKLSACKCHAFRRMDDSSKPRWQCRACEGVIPNYLKEWYDRGIADAFFVACEGISGEGWLNDKQ
jgi:hypothetical protein